MISKTVKYFCKDFTKIENYEKAIIDSKMWECHHRLELDGPVPLSRTELIGLDMYYHRPAEELIFLTRSEHNQLHHKGKKFGPRSEDAKRKCSEAFKGKHHSEETKKKISESHKGIPSPRKGKHWKLIDGKRVWY